MIYFRCNSGHYFSGEACPWDGWSDSHLAQVTLVSAKTNSSLSIQFLREEGIPEHILKRIVIAEFGDDKAIPEAICPEALLIDGKMQGLHEIDDRFA